ncbi:hypothetical protein CpMRi49_08190 [Corynebacterium ulcerans]|uniref:hypothetical protein n=1 Tax=Corynebacterium ulcerans TaxID=65058 RepID=UPI00052A7429|nr:hypothetical protein [Corynebacterium ulcerans]AIU92210.1 Hypothetical protein Cul05146_1651 [Corynebacterium ulcerans]KPH73872.1 hypothetical protein AFK72_11245 [Corynebacterium ulcerans]KPJ25148.1 hypothetical protein AOT31_11340 [Corynebacterium ulcerans]MBL4943304.1 hypothetical protein [Corynebacterium ulcerans]OIS06644.1 hypothetical protein BHG00_03920 [Corynebacterium ulcerans]
MIEIGNRHLVDADALAIMDSIWEKIPDDLRAYAALSCDEGEEISAAITVLDYALQAKVVVPIETLNLARNLADALTYEADIRRVRAIVSALQGAHSKAA